MADFYSELDKWLAKEEWSLHELAILMLSLSPDHYKKLNDKDWKECLRIKEALTGYFMKGGQEIKRIPTDCIALAYDAGTIIPTKLIKYYEYETKTKLSYSPTGQVRQEFLRWANMPYWSSNESITLLCGAMPASKFPAFYAPYINDVEDISDLIQRAVFTGQLKIIGDSTRENPMLLPREVMKWTQQPDSLISLPELLIAVFKCDDKVSTTKGEIHCKEWLEREMEKSPDKQPHPKIYYQDIAIEKYKEKYKVTKRGFNRAWSAAIKNSNWGKSGRRQKLKL
jgi:hypothetical protein